MPLSVLALQLRRNLARFESAGASALHTLPFSLNSGDATGVQESLLGGSVLATSPFIGQLCRAVDAQSTAQPWHAEPLTTLQDM